MKNTSLILMAFVSAFLISCTLDVNPGTGNNDNTGQKPGPDEPENPDNPGDTPEAPAPYGATPSEAQVEWQKMETNMFIHFGPNTFTNLEWGEGTDSEIAAFNPASVDCDSCVSVARECGF